MPSSRILIAVALTLAGTLSLSGCFTVVAGAPVSVPEVAETEQDDDFGTVEIYAVLDDASLDPIADGLASDVWDTFTRVATVDFTGDVMNEYRVGDAPDSDTLAYVYQSDDPEKWVLAANLATSGDTSQLVATLIHEYAHILTLDTTQVEPGAESCTTLELDEGCLYEDSVLQAFTAEFWSGYGEEAPPADNSDSDIGYEFYLAREDDFVSDYAATNVVEDIAESFMTFVLEDEPTGDSVVAQKLQFFWNYPEFVANRERIRAEFATDLGLT